MDNNFSSEINNNTNSQTNIMSSTENNVNLNSNSNNFNTLNNINNQNINSTQYGGTNLNQNSFSSEINNDTNSQTNIMSNTENNVNLNSNSNNNQNSNLNNFNTLNNINNQNINSTQYGGTNLNQNNSPKKDKNKKIVLIILLLLVLIGVVTFFVLKKIGTNKTDIDLNYIFDPNNPIIVKNNEKYGYITSDGKIMIEPQYNNATDFYGDYAVVNVDNPNKSYYKDTIYQIIDKEGTVKLTSESYDEPTYYSNYNIWVIDDVLYDSNLNKLLGEEITVDYISNGYFKYVDRLNNETGIMTYKGKKIFSVPGTYIFVEISDNEYNKDDLYAEVLIYNDSKKNDSKKNVVISLKTGDILFTSEDAESYYISGEGNGIFYYYKHTDEENGYGNRKYLFFINNKLAYQTTEKVYNFEVYNYADQILEIDYGYKYEEMGKSQEIYYYDVKNKKMLDKKPSNSTSLNNLEIDLIEQSYGFKKFSSSGKYGIMSGDKVLVPCEYDDIKYLDINLFNYMKSRGKKLILLEKDKKVILYNIKKSKSITTFNSNYIQYYDDSTFIKISLYDENDHMIKGYIVYNLLSGKSMDFEKNDNIEIGSNYITVKKDGKKTYYNTEFKQIYVANEI